jgi:hypothetical protein
MPLPAAAHLAIEQLYARYNHAVDRGDGVAWAACFTPDGVFTSFGRVYEGRAAIVALAESTRGRPPGRHWLSNLVLEPADFGARGTAYLAWLHITKSPVTMPTTGIYDDEIVPTPEGWLFRSRTFVSDL